MQRYGISFLCTALFLLRKMTICFYWLFLCFSLSPAQSIDVLRADCFAVDA